MWFLLTPVGTKLTKNIQKLTHKADLISFSIKIIAWLFIKVMIL